MEARYAIFKEVIEVIYMLSGIGIIAGLVLTYMQLKQMRKEYKTTNKRAAIEKSIEYLNLFATTIIPIHATYGEELAKFNVQEYKGPKNKEFRFDSNCNANSEYIRDLLNAAFKSNATHLMNRLEYFSAAMLSGLADEELAFTPLAETYCEMIEEFYVMLCYTRRKENSDLYSNTVNLYGMWKNRLDKVTLEKNRDNLDKQISKIDSKKIPTFWKG